MIFKKKFNFASIRPLRIGGQRINKKSLVSLNDNKLGIGTLLMPVKKTWTLRELYSLRNVVIYLLWL